MMATPREAAVALTANGITKSQYQGFCRANDSMAGCFVPLPKISQVRVDGGTHGLGLLQLVEEWIDIFNLHGKHNGLLSRSMEAMTVQQ